MTLGTLERLAFRVNHRPGAQPVYNYRKRISPPALIRDRLRDGTPGPEMIALRGGTFRRGDLQGDGDGDEQPPRELNLRPFAIGLYEVTFEAYDRFCESSGRDLPDDAGWGRGRRPVVNVSWNDAVAYADWLSGQTGQRYRLPTDAEWEYAARAGTRHRFWWGDDVGAAHANCAGCGSLWDSVMTSPVGSFDPNPFGLHDTAGNVFEWVADCWNDTFENAPADGAALIKPDCGIRVIRGGAWSFPPKEVRSANRWRDFQPRTSDDTGFRLVRELDPP
ncbi:MAG TPA: formylglycine-generating enzyme family protein [Sedimenticola sp.]|nr:formylglycine-generating enzyme family protein [Sedimenticola sp.]